MITGRASIEQLADKREPKSRARRSDTSTSHYDKRNTDVARCGTLRAMALGCHTGLENAEFMGITRPFLRLLSVLGALIDRRSRNNTVGVDSNGRWH